jgi:hypothetical protein
VELLENIHKGKGYKNTLTFPWPAFNNFHFLHYRPSDKNIHNYILMGDGAS